MPQPELSSDAVALLLGYKRRAERLKKKDIPDFVSGREMVLFEYALKLGVSRRRELPVTAVQELAPWLAQFVRTRMLRGSGLALALIENTWELTPEEGREWVRSQPDLSALVRKSIEEILAAAPMADKRIAFQTLRARDPARARALLEHPPSGLTPEDRRRLFASMKIGLSSDDREFLERENNRGVLRLLADSKPWRELGEELARYVDVADGALKVSLPTQYTDFFQSWTIPKASDDAAMSDQELWLSALLTEAPMKYLERRWNLQPEAILELFLASVPGRRLIPSIVSSTRIYRDAEWSRAMMDRYDSWSELRFRGTAPIPPGAAKAQLFAHLIPNLPPAEREKYSEAILHEEPNFTPSLFDDVIECIWSVPFSRIQIARAVNGPPGKVGQVPATHFSGSRAHLLHHCDAAVVSELSELIASALPAAEAARVDLGKGLQERDAIRLAM
jgi:hypothetical protein